MVGGSELSKRNTVIFFDTVNQWHLLQQDTLICMCAATYVAERIADACSGQDV